MRTKFALCLVVLLLACPASVLAAIEPVMRYSEVRATASVGGNTDTEAEMSGNFDKFEETVGAAIIDATGDASATVSQRSDLSDEIGRIFASGGTAAISDGLASSSGLSVFRYSFEMEGANQLVRLTSAIAASDRGDVSVSFKDISLPEPTFFARRAPDITTGPAAEIEDYWLLAGHVYDIEISATSATGQQGTTSYTFTLSAVPEPGMGVAAGAALVMLARRRRRG
jgi:hypothetical protein